MLSSVGFTFNQASQAEFHKDLDVIPVRFPTGRITCINNHPVVPFLKFEEDLQDRLDHLEISTLHALLTTIESDRSAILFIEYHLAWFGVDKPDQMLKFNEVCRKRAQKGGPVG